MLFFFLNSLRDNQRLVNHHHHILEDMPVLSTVHKFWQIFTFHSFFNLFSEPRKPKEAYLSRGCWKIKSLHLLWSFLNANFQESYLYFQYTPLQEKSSSCVGREINFSNQQWLVKAYILFKSINFIHPLE